MLYITRKIGESVIIDNEIELKVIDVSGKTVRLGFESPEDATILRKELFEKIQEENIKAANAKEDIASKIQLKEKETEK